MPSVCGGGHLCGDTKVGAAVKSINLSNHFDIFVTSLFIKKK